MVVLDLEMLRKDSAGIVSELIDVVQDEDGGTIDSHIARRLGSHL